MGLISLIETRGNSVNDPAMWINTLLESSNYATKAGTVITADTALKISTVYACVTILAQTIASLPMTVNRRLKSGGNETAEDHWLYSVLHDEFNAHQTSYEAREMGMVHLKLVGNWYNRIERNGRGQIDGLWPMNPAYMQVSRAGGEVWYAYEPGNATDPLGNPRKVYSADEIWHIKGISADGLTGLKTVWCARESMGLAQALQDFTAEFFGRQAVPGNVLEHPQALSATARANLKESLEKYANEKRHTTLILEEGMKWNSTGASNKDSQFLELSGAQVRDIARYFDVPLVLLQEPDKVATYASVTEFMLSFAKLTIWKITRRVESSANKSLLTPSERRAGYYVKFNLKGMQEGDFNSRMEGYQIARLGGWKNADDILALEDENPLPDGQGKAYWRPSNMVEVGNEPEPAPVAVPAPAVEPAPPEGDGNG